MKAQQKREKKISGDSGEKVTLHHILMGELWWLHYLGWGLRVLLHADEIQGLWGESQRQLVRYDTIRRHQWKYRYLIG